MPKKDNLENLKSLIVLVSSNNFSSINYANSTFSNSYIVELNRSHDKMVMSKQPITSQTDVGDSSANVRQKIAKKKWKSKHQSEVNASERERKGRLAANIRKLKEILPMEPVKLQSKEIILEEAIKYIEKLKEQVEEMLLKDAPENLVLEITKLRKRVENLEKERKFFERILQSHGLLSSNQGKPPKIPISRCSSKQTGKSSSVAPDSNFCCRTNPSNTPLSTTASCRNQNESFSAASATSSSPPCRISTKITSHNISTTSQSGDLFAPLCTRAFCTPTYSVARMKHAPPGHSLPNVATDCVKEANSNSKNDLNKSNEALNAVSTNSPASVPCSASSACDLIAKPSSAGVSSAQQNTALKVAASVASAQVSCTVPSSFRSWLRGDASSIDDSLSRVESGSLVTQVAAQQVERKTQSNAEESTKSSRTGAASPPISNRKETNSFNIASLMKSKEAASGHQASIIDHQTNTEYNVSPPKDTFHQALDAEIFDCLQFVDAPYKHTVANNSMHVTTASDYSCAYDATNASKLTFAQHKPTLPSFDLDLTQPDVDRTASCSEPCGPAWTNFDFSSESRLISSAHGPETFPDEVHLGSQDRGRSSGVGGHPLSHRYGVSSLQSNPVPSIATASLWQPAVMNNSANRPVKSSLPPMQGCFPPMSYSYLNSSSHQLSHRITSINHQPFNNSHAWLSPTPQYDDFSFGLTTRLTGVPNAEAPKTKAQTSKKRKLLRLDNKTSKKKKNAFNHHQEDSHSISRLIGAHPPAPSPHSRFPTPSFSSSTASNGNQLVPNPNAVPLYQPPAANAGGTSHLGYNSYGPQPNLFHSSSVTPQTPYAPSHAPYFYNPTASAPTRGNVYVPGYANMNNNNSNVGLQTKPKAPQHHISRILS